MISKPIQKLIILFKICFGLSFLPPEMVIDVFVFNLMVIALTGCEEFTGYILLNNYVSKNSKYPPHVWTECSNSIKTATNACEAFHSKFNSDLYYSHSHIFQFIEVLKPFQINTYVLICLH